MNLAWIVLSDKTAEEERFELSIRLRRMPVFETGAFNHSATPPSVSPSPGAGNQSFHPSIFFALFQKNVINIQSSLPCEALAK
jgi:hypothetical protein